MRPDGTGLGLAIVHQIARGHGGDVRIESVEGEGTTVTISLPVTVRVSPAAEPSLTT
jgi:signal transduction histidine kinase